jgi:hypothetical protein
MNIGNGNKAVQFHFWEYRNWIFSTVHPVRSVLFLSVCLLTIHNLDTVTVYARVSFVTVNVLPCFFLCDSYDMILIFILLNLFYLYQLVFSALFAILYLVSTVCVFIYIFFFMCVRHLTQFHLPPLRFFCVEGRWDRTQGCCDFGIDS